jgi:hypothetical protein
MNSHNIDSDEAIQGGDEALNALSLQFLRSVNALSLRFFTQHLTLHRRCFLRKIIIYFLIAITFLNRFIA